MMGYHKVNIFALQLHIGTHYIISNGDNYENMIRIFGEVDVYSLTA